MTSGRLNVSRGGSQDRGLHVEGVGLRDVLLVILLVSFVVLVHIGMPGSIPSGADGGNWLAVARERLGADVLSADVAYPPLFPFLVALGIPLLGAVPSLVLAALLAKSLIVLAVFVCSRPVGRWYAFGAAVCSGVGGAQLEAYAWGGYPQLMGTAFALLTVFLLVRWLGDSRRTSLLLTGVLGILTFATHTLIGGLLVVAMPLAAIHWLHVTRSERQDWLRAAISVLALAVPGGVVVVSSTIVAAQAGATAVLNPYGLGRFESIEQTIRDAALPWVIVGVLGLVGLGGKELKGAWAATLAVGSSWSLVGLAFFLVTGEARALLLTQVGLIILACLAVHRVFGWIRRRDGEWKRSRTRRLAFPAMVTLLVSMATAIVAGGLVSYSAAITWYRVADQEVLEALDWLKENSRTDDLMVASAGPNGNPLGWWVQGYGERQTYTGIDVRFVSFPDERVQAEVANEIFDEATTEMDTLSLLSKHGIDFLVVDRRGPSSSWLFGEVAAGFVTLYESPSVTILEAVGT